MSKKIYPVVIVVQFVFMILFLMYALVQRDVASKNEYRAVQNEQRANESESKALQERIRSEQALREAQIQRQVAQKALNDCAGSKKK